MGMKKLKSTKEHTIYERRDGRYAVKDRRNKWVHGDDKAALLSTEGLITLSAPKPAEPEAAAETEGTADDQQAAG
jgi:hypothetical protein